MEKVSVIITTYNRGPDIVRRAINSVINQTYDNIEIIVVDDNPVIFKKKEDIKIMIDSLGSPIKYIEHKKNMGACAARNTGINNSTGSYVAFLDDDDEWLPTKIEKQMKCFSDTNIGMVYCLFWINTPTNKAIYSENTIEGNVYDNLLVDNYIGGTSVVILKKEVAIKAGLFDTKMKSAQDIDMWLRCSKLCHVACVREPLVNYYAHDSERITTNVKNKIQGMERILFKYENDIKDNSEAKWKRTMKLSAMYALNKEYKRSIHTYRKALILMPKRIHENLYYFKMILFYLIQNKFDRAKE